MLSLPLLWVVVASSLAAAQRQVTAISVATNLTTRVLHQDVYGYSIEPVWVSDFIGNNITITLLRAITNVTGGQPPPIRVGGNTADQTYILDDGVLNTTAIAIPNAQTARQLNISRSWFDAWGSYFPEGTNLTYTLNLHINDSDFAIARRQAEAAWRGLGTKLVRFEVGNEVDHFINKGWRNSSWGVGPYAAQFRQITDAIRQTAWYRDAGDRAPAFAAGSFADPPWVPDQQDQIDDMDILNLTTRAGLVNERRRDGNGEGLHIDSYAVHMYPMSTCDPARWRRMRLDLLSNHTAVWLNVSQYGPQAEAAAQVGGAPLVMGETNSVSCGGRSGISDTFGAALWGVDYTLSLASVGAEHVYYHLGGRNEYSSFQPLGYDYKNESLSAGVRPGFYAHYFVAHVVRPVKAGAGAGAVVGSRASPWHVAALPGANASDLSGFGIYSSSGRTLHKVVLLDMGVWNGTEALGNPSTISAADNVDPAYHSAGARPVREVALSTPWCVGAEVRVVRLTAPGTNAKSGVRVGGWGFDPATGRRVGGEGEAAAGGEEVLRVGRGGAVGFTMNMAEGVLLEVVGNATCGSGNGSGSSSGSGGGSGGGNYGSGAPGYPSVSTAMFAVGVAVWATLIS